MTMQEWHAAMFTITLFTIGAVALILYQHSKHAGIIVNAVGAAGGTPVVDPAATSAQDSGPPIAAASLAGTPTPGQSNLVPTPNNVYPLAVGANYQMGV